MKTYLLELCRGHCEGSLIPTITFYFVFKRNFNFINTALELMKFLDCEIKDIINCLNLEITSEEWLDEQFSLEWHQTSDENGAIWDHLECETEEFYIFYRQSTLFESGLEISFHKLCRIDIHDFYEKYNTDLESKIDLECHELL